MDNSLQTINNLPVSREEIQDNIRSIDIDIDDFNDKGFGRMFALIFKKVLRYNRTRKSWYYYDGKVWLNDLGRTTAERYAKFFADGLISLCENLGMNKTTMKPVYRLNDHAKRNTIIDEAKSEHPFDEEDFDRDIYLLNCKNGTLDLRTGKFREHNADDLLSKIANVDYVEGATCERWIQFMNEVMEGDSTMIDYLQRILGMCLTGDTKEEEFYILYGPKTRNGKSTLLEIMRFLLGNTKGYAVNTEASTFSVKTRTGGTPSSDKVRLAGARLVTVNEWHKNTEINGSMLKDMTGGEQQTGRAMRENEIQFLPQFKLFINTNHLPKINDDSIFASNRVNVILFNRHFSEDEQDKSLKETLKQPENLSGILNWLLEGLKKYREYGLTRPQSVIELTAKYREDNDKIGSFIHDCLVASNENVTHKNVYEVFKIWCIENGCGTEKLQNFKEQLGQKLTIEKTASVGTPGHKKTEYNVVIGYVIADEWRMKIDKRDNKTEYEAKPRPNRVEITDPTELF